MHKIARMKPWKLWDSIESWLGLRWDWDHLATYFSGLSQPKIFSVLRRTAKNYLRANHNGTLWHLLDTFLITDITILDTWCHFIFDTAACFYFRELRVSYSQFIYLIKNYLTKMIYTPLRAIFRLITESTQISGQDRVGCYYSNTLPLCTTI